MTNYVVVLGSNLPSEFGDSFETLKKCIYEIKTYLPIKSLIESNWYISSSFLDKKEPRYLNVGIRFSTDLSPKELIKFTSGLENKYGRRRKRRVSSRPKLTDVSSSGSASPFAREGPPVPSSNNCLRPDGTRCFLECEPASDDRRRSSPFHRPRPRGWVKTLSRDLAVGMLSAPPPELNQRGAGG